MLDLSHKFEPVKIRTYGDPSLRTKCALVKDRNSERVKKIADLLRVMCSQADGLGLAAPQVGILERIIVIDMTHYGGEFYTMINPVITSRSKEEFYTQEGCLSIPDTYAEVPRPKFCTVEFYDLSGKKKKIRAEGLLSTAIHHEIDHLDGILFVDRIDDEQFKGQILASLMLKKFDS